MNEKIEQASDGFASVLNAELDVFKSSDKFGVDYVKSTKRIF